MRQNVKEFYQTFDFEKIITNPPKLIQEFLDGEINFLKSYIKDKKDILEVGCGYGRLIKVLAPKSKKITGIDFSEPLLMRAKKNLSKTKNAKLLLMDGKKIDLPQNSYDYVLCLDSSFGNMPGIELRVIKQMKKICKKDGEIIISVFSQNAKKAQIQNYKRIGLKNITNNGKAIHTAEGFYSRRFSKKDLKEIFASVGLKCKITKICPINYIAIAKK